MLHVVQHEQLDVKTHNLGDGLAQSDRLVGIGQKVPHNASEFMEELIKECVLVQLT